MLYRVRAEILNLRTDPTITAAVRSVLLKGETFTVLRFVQNNQWAQVRLSNGREGYVFAPYIEKVNP